MKKKVPKIRFNGFTDDWRYHKCGEVLQERNVQHPYSEKFPLVSFTVEKGVTPKTERYEREQLVDGDKTAKKYKETRFDDIVYNPANLKFGAIARNKYGNAVFSPIYVTYEVDKYLADPSFVERYVTRDSFIQNALKYQQGTVYERMAVSPEDFNSLDIIIPSKGEQESIGHFFDTIDNLLTLSERKLEALKHLKSSMLAKMFPKEGENAPEIRFKGFVEPWVQRKLNTMLSFSNGFNGGREVFGSGTKLISVMDILNNPFITYDIIRGEANVTSKECERFKVEYGDVLFQRSSENIEDAGSSNVYLDKERTAIFGGFVIRGKKESEYNPIYMKYLLDSHSVRKQITSKAQGAQHINVSQDILSDITVFVPCMKEQNEIANLFIYLEKTITLYQRKLEKLIDLKNSMLSNMFPKDN